MTKAELIAALDPYPDDTPVVREFSWGETFIAVRHVNAVRRDVAHFSEEATDGRQLYHVGASKDPAAVLTISLD